MFGAPRGGRARGREQASALPGRLMQASPGRAEQECTSGRRKKARTAEQKRAPDRTRQDRRSKSVPRAGRQEGLGRRSRNAPRAGRERAGPAEQKRAPGRQIRTAPRPSGLFHAADQPQGVSAAESPRRRRRTRRSGTPRGPAPSGRGSRRRWPRCRVRPAGRRFGRRFRPDCAAAAARRPAA